ncbi:hypothetical protein QR685DRAFT_56316 [Neurospora intermedia]|uniref:N-acetylglucosamine-induced protein 1 n=1 Tax=Neurospora intermedia TaxID=5142 RepID=A0ABR3DSP4_NEUIN
MGSITIDHQLPPTPDHQLPPTPSHPDHLNNPPPLYWHINAPPHHPSRTSPTCPPFLLLLPPPTPSPHFPIPALSSLSPPSPQYLSPKDFTTIITPNHLYKRDTWPQVVRRVQENKLAEFQRTPADMWRYLEFCWQIKQTYKKGGIKEFILRERLKWGSGSSGEVVARGSRFRDCEEGEDGDVKILWNDWPYGVDEKIVHLVVWTKFQLEDDPKTGDLTEEARAEIDEFVKKKFQVGGRMAGEHIIWFKNWAHIKSVKAVEHFHVMLFDPDPEFVREITKGDVPLGIIHTDELTTNKNCPSTFSTTEEETS